MPLTREEYLTFCQVCVKRKFNPQKGLVCSLTNEHADYDENECPSLEIDHVARDKREAQEQIRQEEELNSSTFGLAQFGIKNQTIAGLIIIGLAVIWLVVGLYMGWIFYYPIILIVLGLFTIFQDEKRRRKEKKIKVRKNADHILDEDI